MICFPTVFIVVMFSPSIVLEIYRSHILTTLLEERIVTFRFSSCFGFVS